MIFPGGYNYLSIRPFCPQYYGYYTAQEKEVIEKSGAEVNVGKNEGYDKNATTQRIGKRQIFPGNEIK